MYFTQKRLEAFDAVEGKDTAAPTFSILLRATDGARDKTKKVKVSTVIEADKVDQFWTEYANTLKNGITGLKKKEKKKAKKAKKVSK